MQINPWWSNLILHASGMSCNQVSLEFSHVALVLVGYCGGKHTSESTNVVLVFCRMEFTVYICIFCLFECRILLSWCYPRSSCGYSVKWLNWTALLVGQTFVILWCLDFNATPILFQFLYAATPWVIIFAKEHSLK